MNTKPLHLSKNDELGSLFREEARMIVVHLVFWLGAITLLAVPVWLPLIVEVLIKR